MSNDTIGEKLKEVRAASGLSQAQLGKKINVSQQTINSWEQGKRKPKAEARNKIAVACGVDKDTLLLILTL